MNMTRTKRTFPYILLLLLLVSCSHNYDSNTLDLSFYQWNLWPDTEADVSTSLPSCGWEVLHRGNGKLVRIPARMNEHFETGEDAQYRIPENYASVYWFHCRFTLPELWAERQIILRFENAGPEVGIYLNEQHVDYHSGTDESFDVDITRQVYYTRDNHLAIRITDPGRGSGGIAGNLVVVSKDQTTDE